MGGLVISTQVLICVHVGAGATWLAVSVTIAARRAVGRWFGAAQAGASALTLLAGILLWHALHSNGMGPPEHWLVVGSFCAFVAIGLQAGVVATVARGRLSTAQLGLHAASVAVLATAAAAMVASRFAA